MSDPLPNVRIRRGAPEDAAQLSSLALRTFRDAFMADNRPEDVEGYVAQVYGIRQQSAELEDPRHLTLVVQSDDAMIAFAQLRADAPPAMVTGLAPVELRRFYVGREWHGRGVAARLMAAVHAAAARLGYETMWLGVWERNERARAFYRKCGFVDIGSQPFQLGDDLQTDRVMVVPVRSADAPASA